MTADIITGVSKTDELLIRLDESFKSFVQTYNTGEAARLERISNLEKRMEKADKDQSFYRGALFVGNLILNLGFYAFLRFAK